jgi:hypothetical protein
LIDDHVNQRSQEEKKPRALIRVTQRELREAFTWSDFSIRKHLARLVELEYVLVHRTGQGNQRQYELVYDGQGREGEKFLLGLVETGQLKQTPSSEGNERLAVQNEPHSSPQRAPNEPHSSTRKNGVTHGVAKALRKTNGKPARNKVKRT